jgi:cobalt-zinc-cadmium efflux system protein
MSMSKTKNISNKRPLILSWLLNSAFTVIELIIGFATGSLALIADGMRNLTDSVTLSIAFAAEHLSAKKSDSTKTFGYGRVKIIASLLNTGILFAVAIFIGFQAISRFNHPRSLSGTTIALVAAGGAIVNGVAAALLHSQRKDLNIGSTYIGLKYGAIGSLGILLAGVLIATFKYYWIDDVAGLTVALMLLAATAKLTKDALHILLEGVPESIDIKQVTESLRGLELVHQVKDVHAWTIHHEDYAFSCRLVMDFDKRSDSHSTVSTAKEILVNKYGFTHTTVEVILV